MALDDLQPDALYHLASADEWADYQGRGTIDPASITAEGFVHCSYGRQVAGTVTKHFDGVTGLLALELDPAALGDVELVDEDSYGSGQAFPHAYGAIPASAVIGTTSVT
jgi:uncharacterized protein (DUF952 family)